MRSLRRKAKRPRLVFVVPVASVLCLVALVPNPSAHAASLGRVSPARPDRRASAVPAVVTLAPADLTAPAGVGMQTPTTAQSLVASRKIAVAWSAQDSGSGIASYDVRLRSAEWDGALGGYSPFESATTAKSSTFTGAFGWTYCFSTRARDKNKNISNWSVDRCTSVPLDDAHLTTSTFTRATKVSGALNGTLSITTKKGATLGRSGVVARSITLLARTCPTCGSVAVKWNGKVTASLNLAGPSSTRVFPVAHFAKPTAGGVQVVVTSSGKRVVIDALDVSVA